MNHIDLISQVAADYQPFAQFGLNGIMLGFFMYLMKDMPKDIRTLAHRVDGLTRALLVDMAERDSCGTHTKRYAREEIAKIDSRLADK